MRIRPLLTVKQAFSQIRRNKGMAIASFISITAILLILGIFFILIVNIENISQSVKQNFDTVQINLLDDTDEATREALMKEFASYEGVADVAFQTRDEALQHWKEKWGDNADLLDRLPQNPLPNAIIITLTDVSYSQQVVGRASGAQGIDKINYSQETINKLLDITSVVQLIALVLIVFLLIVSIVVVSNTIKLTVLAREREITIMRYVGATNWFIRGPFLMEGIIIGIISALITMVVITVGYHWLVQAYGVDFILIMSAGFVKETYLIPNLGIIFISLGVSIGACGSIISMRRFLRR